MNKWRSLIMMTFLATITGLWMIVSCGTKQPAVVDQTLKNPTNSLSHVNLTSNCQRCHEAERPAPNVDIVLATNAPLSVAHGLGGDCLQCHSFGQFTNVNAFAKGHNPPPKACMGCHSRARQKTVHVPRGECVTCHSFGAAWVPK
ncbi:MAG: hypothetical protein H7249_06380 [Chitinophagaceae bacterium]|nr:hypothetical protein [Oligoflexus sp.]